MLVWYENVNTLRIEKDKVGTVKPNEGIQSVMQKYSIQNWKCEDYL